MTRFRILLSWLAVAIVLVFVSADANARAGGGLSFGSRGTRTFMPPAATSTAPNAAAPIQRSMTPSSQPSVAQPGGGFFRRPGLLGGLAAGFLGAGLFGMLFGNGLFGGLGGFASILGLLFQVVLIAVAARFIWAWWQRRHAPAFAGSSMLRGAMPDVRGAMPNANYGSALGAGGAAPRGTEVRIGPDDFETFERRLGEVQTAYGAEDLNALRAMVTPEMLSYFAEELAKNASRGVVNRLADVKLLQGDLAEAWREGRFEYASVAMRFSLIDQTIDRGSGRVVEGNASTPTQATELWTFMRSPPGSWLLSAIQQA